MDHVARKLRKSLEEYSNPKLGLGEILVQVLGQVPVQVLEYQNLEPNCEDQ